LGHGVHVGMKQYIVWISVVKILRCDGRISLRLLNQRMLLQIALSHLAHG